jgi:hypothetical protein
VSHRSTRRSLKLRQILDGRSTILRTRWQ